MEFKPSNLKAAFWMSGSLAAILMMAISGREASKELNVFQIMEMRSLIGLAMLYPLIRSSGGVRAMRTGRIWQHIGRNTAHYAGQFAWLQALSMIPLAQVIAIEFTTPAWTAVMAVAFLGERFNLWRTLTILLGIVGVVIIVRPGVGSIEMGQLIVLGAAFTFGISFTMVKSLTRTESVVKIIFWMLVIQSAIGLLPALHVWQWPTLQAWPWVVIDPLAEREKAVAILDEYEERLAWSRCLFRATPSLADMAILPFVRQFASVDADWWSRLARPHVKRWLGEFVSSGRFDAVMLKYPKWQVGDAPTLFGVA